MFRKAFFPTEEEVRIQENILNNIHTRRVFEYMTQGISETDAEEKINIETELFTNRGYYS